MTKLTPADIAALPDRELDALLAQLMGWTFEPNTGQFAHIVPGWWFAPNATIGIAEGAPHYSTDHAAAAEAVAFVIERTSHYLTLYSPYMPNAHWQAGFTPHGCSGWNGRPDIEAKGPIEPRAKAEASALALLRMREDTQ